MSASLMPFGLRPVQHMSGRIRPVRGQIASAYSTSIYGNDPVKLLSTGYMNLAGTTGAFIGSFQGCEFPGTDGRWRYSNFWQASTVTLGNVDVFAYYTRDPSIIYEIQANGSLAMSSLGSQANFSSAIGTTIGTVGVSQCTLDTGTLTNSSQAQVRILELSYFGDNAFGDAFTIVQVAPSLHQNVAAINAY